MLAQPAAARPRIFSFIQSNQSSGVSRMLTSIKASKSYSATAKEFPQFLSPKHVIVIFTHKRFLSSLRALCGVPLLIMPNRPGIVIWVVRITQQHRLGRVISIHLRGPGDDV